MIDGRTKRTWARSTALALIATAVSFAVLDIASAQGMNVMRAPNIDVGSRIPVNPTIAPRVDPNIAGRVNTVTPTTNVISVDRVHAADHAAHQPEFDDALCALLAEPLSGLRCRFPRCHGECAGDPAASAAAAAEQEHRQAGQEGRQFVQRWRPKRVQPHQLSQPVRCRDRRRPQHRADRRAGAAPRPGAGRSAEFSIDQRHHRPVPHRRKPSGRRGAPQLRRRRQREIAVHQFPLFRAGHEDERRRSGAICGAQAASCRRRMRWRTA